MKLAPTWPWAAAPGEAGDPWCPVMLLPPVLVLAVSLAPGVRAAISVDGMWSPWSTVKSYCVDPLVRQNLVTCGGGVETKYRSCTNPAPQGGGQACVPEELPDGTTITTTRDLPCNEDPCPLPNNFMWSEWSECSARCGRGEQRRYKMCGSVRTRLPGMINCHQKVSHTTTETPQTIPPNQWPPGTVAQPPAAAGGSPSSSVSCTVAGDPTTPQDTAEPLDNTQNTNWQMLYELELSSQCSEQPDLVDEEVNATTGAVLNTNLANRRECNTWYYYPEYPWLWNHTNCPDPCLTYKCPKFAKCTTASSTKEDKVIECECQMGTVMKADNSSCIVPPPTPTPRPIPTMAAEVKSVTGGLSKGASTLIIIFLSITLLLFLIFRIFTPSRVIHMCEELSLLAAHCCMLPTLYSCEEEDPLDCRPVTQCKVISIAIHYFFTTCFTFMFLEAIYLYGLVASVIKKNGMLATKQNIVIGWGLPAFIILFKMCFHITSNEKTRELLNKVLPCTKSSADDPE